MNEKEAQEFLTLGVNTGIFIMASIISEHEPAFTKVKDLAALEIQKTTGTPAEDWALKLDGMLAGVRDNIEQARKDSDAQ